MSPLVFFRAASITAVILLALQFELGMAVNLSPSLQEVPPLKAAPAAVWEALAKVGAGAPEHAVLGFLLAAIALASIMLAARSGKTSLVVSSIVSFLAIAMAAVNGVLFTLSGFKNDGYSHGMATTFLVAFSAQFVQICIVTIELRKRRSPGRPLRPD